MGKKRVLVAIDSFKGCMTSQELNDKVSEELIKMNFAEDVFSFPVSDGGEGIRKAIVSALKSYNCDLENIKCDVHDPLMRDITADYTIVDLGKEFPKTAIIEMAETAGLVLLSEFERNPIYASTFGFGEMIADAISKGCKEIILGIGGSATNDAGFGMLKALGYRLLDVKGREISYDGRGLKKFFTIDDSNSIIDESIDIKVACDVTNVLSGKEGAAYIFAPQKGADQKMVKELDLGLKNVAFRIKEFTSKDLNYIPGAGAAGGVGGILFSVLKAKMFFGAELLFTYLDLDTMLDHVDMLITGEGKMDAQTLMGKAPFSLLKHAKSHKPAIPVIAITGKIEAKEALLEAGFSEIYCIHDYNTGDPVPKKLMDKEYSAKRIVDTIDHICKVSTSC